MRSGTARHTDGSEALWGRLEVRSPTRPTATSCVAARDIAFIENAHRFQTLNIYLPATSANLELIGRPVAELPHSADDFASSLVHIHGGAWRDPNLTAASIEPSVAHAFAEPRPNDTLAAISSINYSISPFPTHPTEPYDPIRDNHTDIAREAIHPQQFSDVLHGFALLRDLGLRDDSYLLSGHSAGAFLAFGAFLRPPAAYGLPYLPEAPPSRHDHRPERALRPSRAGLCGAARRLSCPSAAGLRGLPVPGFWR